MINLLYFTTIKHYSGLSQYTKHMQYFKENQDIYAKRLHKLCQPSMDDFIWRLQTDVFVWNMMLT